MLRKVHLFLHVATSAYETLLDNCMHRKGMGTLLVFNQEQRWLHVYGVSLHVS